MRVRVGGVSTDELVGAVRDLLCAAGAPPTLEQTSMLAAHQRLRADLAAATRAVSAAAEAGFQNQDLGIEIYGLRFTVEGV